MNKNLQMVYTYHNETKHAPTRYARSLGYMDWATQPDPYRTYLNTKQIELPLSFENHTFSYKDIFENKKEIAPFCLESISQFFQFSLGLAAVKSYEDQSWALRCNASSGNLQPSESYIIANDITGIEDGLYHYGVKEHTLEQLSTTKKKLDIPKDSFVLGLTSIVWREAWKYGERSWRYTQLDCGHAFKALEISAKILGWNIQIINTNDKDISSLLGLDDVSRYVPEETEHSDMLLLVSKDDKTKSVDVKNLRESLQDKYNGKANILSASRHRWDILEDIEQSVTSSEDIDVNIFKSKQTTLRECEYKSKDIVLKRRSAQVMDKDDTHISKKEFETILSSVVSKNSSPVNLVLFVHDVENLPTGLYILVGDNSKLEDLKVSMKELFLWEKVNCGVDDLYLLQGGGFKLPAKTISCNQDIAAHGAFSLGMLVEFDHQLTTHGAHRYKELYWNCGAIGQQLYLEATSLHLSATGIGCFLDDILHDLLGITNTKYQSLYHFTIGRGLVDSRLTNEEPYKNKR